MMTADFARTVVPHGAMQEAGHARRPEFGADCAKWRNPVPAAQ
jgi:hypothetical protein